MFTFEITEERAIRFVNICLLWTFHLRVSQLLPVYFDVQSQESGEEHVPPFWQPPEHIAEINYIYILLNYL